MIITVLWEDQLGVDVKNFGPHKLLVACLADDLPPDRLKRQTIKSNPKKGNGSVRSALQRDIDRLRNDGLVFAVVDRDKIRDLWKRKPHDCMTGIGARFREDAKGEYDLIFLENNMETLTNAVCVALGDSIPEKKPRPNERDSILNKASWSMRDVRMKIRAACPSFNRIVERVGRKIP